jgi:hypothetical protein
MADAKFTIDGVEVLIDDDMLHLFEKFTWRYARRKRKNYVVSSTSKQGARVHMYLHRLVLGLAKGEVCDHINGDTLDNRRSNLRRVTTKQNNMNSAKKPSKYGNRFRGIAKRHHGFSSQIRVLGKIVCLGTFQSDVEAAYAYDLASIQHHGEFGRRNFLPLVK